jgi:arylsulfatase A-like enzyme
VTYLDAQLRRLFGGLRELGLWTDRTLVVFVADHGEQFGEHGAFEHCDLHVETMRVPLLLRAPGVAPGRSAEPVRLLDLAPTLLELHGLAPLAGAEGRSLLPLLRGEPLPELPAISEHRSWLRVADDDHSYLVLRSRAERLYARGRDPGETTDLAAAEPEVLARMRRLAEAHRRRPRPAAPPPESAPVDDDTREALRALGYAD